MKDINCGYYSFGKGLGDALLRQNHQRFNLKYYLFRNNPYLFNGKVDILYLSKFHRIYFPFRNEFHLVHFSDQTCRLKPTKVNATKIMTIHDLNKVHLKFSKPHRIKVYIEKLRKLISECDKIVAISGFVGDDILRYFPEAKDKLRIIYNGADKLVVPKDHKPVIIPAKKFLFAIGLLSKQKGFHLLPALLQGNDLELIISGIETPHKQKIIEEAEKYNCLKRVHITGPITDNDKAWYYKNCTAFVFPSIAEGFGLPVIEAMHFGKPVFLSKFTSLPEVGGNVAYYFDNFNAAHMQSVFAKGMQDFENRKPQKEIMEQAAKFSWDKAAIQYLELYDECLR